MSTTPSGPAGPKRPGLFGKALLTFAGLFVITCGGARLFTAEGPAAVAIGVPLIFIGVGVLVIAAFYDNVGGIIRYFNSEIWFGRRRDEPDPVEKSDNQVGPPKLTPVAGPNGPSETETHPIERGPPSEGPAQELR